MNNNIAKMKTLTATFYDRWDNKDEFIEFFKASPLTINIENGEIEEIYYQLVAEYMQSNFKFRDKIQQDLKVMQTIKNFYPVLKKKLDIQKRILDMSIEELAEGTAFVNSGLVTPDVDNVNATNKDMPFVSEKRLSQQLASERQALQTQFNLLVNGLWEEFISRFKDLFVMLIVGTDTLFTMDNEEWNEQENY